MTGRLGEEIRRRALRDARRARGWTQSRLADEVGCRQSAISMYERGDDSALAAETIAQIAAKLEVKLEAFPEFPDAPPAGMMVRKFCVNPDCRSNVPFIQGPDVFFLPGFFVDSAAKPSWCPWCGEVMESRCRNEQCRAVVASGVCCTACGTPYVPTMPVTPGRDRAWADAERERILDLRTLARADDGTAVGEKGA